MTKENTTASLTPKSFLHKVLNGTAIGVIVALLPNCIFAIIFSLDFSKIMLSLQLGMWLTFFSKPLYLP